MLNNVFPLAGSPSCAKQKQDIKKKNTLEKRVSNDVVLVQTTCFILIFVQQILNRLRPNTQPESIAKVTYNVYSRNLKEVLIHNLYKF